MKVLQLVTHICTFVLIITASGLNASFANERQTEFIPPEFIPSLTLSQSAYPDILIRFEDEKDKGKTIRVEAPSLSSNPNNFKVTGIISLDVIEHQSPHVYVDFFIEGIRTDMTMDVFLAVSTRPGSKDSWPKSRVGQLMLDPQTLTILAKINSYDLVNYWPTETELGPVGVLMFPEEIEEENSKNSEWVRVSVNIAGLLDSPRLRFVDKLYFQVLTAPMGTVDFEHSQSSNMSYFTIEGR